MLSVLGCTPLTTNEGAKRRVKAGCRTLFVMPFAPYPLTENLVRANWHDLDRIAVIGNAFPWVAHWPSSSDPETEAADEANQREHYPYEGELRAPCVHAAQAICAEVVLWENNHATWLQKTSNDKVPVMEAPPVDETDADAVLPDSVYALNSTLVTFRPLGTNEAHASWAANLPKKVKSAELSQLPCRRSKL